MDWSKEWWRIFVVVFLIMLSGLFSGLTLGLMGLDVMGLEIVIKGGSPSDKRNARKIQPVRQKGNLLLCTLLMGNVAVNAALSIVMADMSDGLIGFFVSTFVIVIFGEIIPQATCSRYALAIGARSICLVKIIIFILLPICWPMSKVLDCMLGEEMGTIYSKNELRQLVQVHRDQKQVKDQEADIMTGALDFADKQVGDIMQPMNKVYMLEVHTNLDFSVLTSIFKSGYSRIPCFDKTHDKVVGLLIVKDLILIDPSDEVPLHTLLNFYGRQLPKCFPDTGLSDMLNNFKAQKSHMAIVHDVDNSDCTKDPVYKNMGIITLEDIMETILKTEIHEETDFDQDKFGDRLVIFDSRRNLPNVLTPQETSAVYFHLSGTLQVFCPGVHLTETGLKRLISESRISEVVLKHKKVNSAGNIMQLPEPWPRPVEEADDVSNGGQYIYQMGMPSEYFCLILDGAVEVRAGREGFRAEAARWTTMGTIVLEQYAEAGPDAERPVSFIPDFSARVSENSRLLRISVKRWAEMMKQEGVVEAELTPQAQERRASMADERKTVTRKRQHSVTRSTRSTSQPAHSGVDLRGSNMVKTNESPALGPAMVTERQEAATTNESQGLLDAICDDDHDDYKVDVTI